MPSWIWIQNVIFPILGMGLGAFLLFGVYRTINRHLDRRHELRLGQGGDRGAEVERLHDRVDALEEQVFRLQELEERLDFAERLLAQHSDRPVLRGDN